MVIVGGGAAGFFGAIACAEALRARGQPCESNQVILLEATAHLLAKVKVSGGGRCNTTHACFDPRELVKRYPRGGRELLGPFYRWGPRETVAWFSQRGVTLKTEEDGRMFPDTDNSQTIIDCLQRAASEAGVTIRPRCGVSKVEHIKGSPELPIGPATSDTGKFRLTLTTNETVVCDRLLLATGGNRSNAGYTIAEAAGHTIEPPVPSLFTFHINDPRIKDLPGVSVENAETAVRVAKLRESGPLLITHWGMSGPAILKLSAWGARLLHDLNYQFTLGINWAPSHTVDTAAKLLSDARRNNPKKQVTTWCPFGFSQRLWERLVAAAGIVPGTVWTATSNDALRALATQVCAGEFAVSGKSLFKEEFVTCGGVKLSEVDFKTMQSRLCPGLYFAGEMLDIDGVTGGFNFQAAWTTGHIAGEAMAE